MRNKTGKPVKESALENQIYSVFPENLNNDGTVFGGYILALIDKVAGMVAKRHAGEICRTRLMDGVSFSAPIFPNDFIVLYASCNRAWNTSMEIGVKVFAEHSATGMRRHITSTYLTFVAVKISGKGKKKKDIPVPVPSVIPESPVEQRRFEAADERRKLRLEGKNDG